MPATDLPAYPSEDAVMSGVTAELMKLLFPAAVEEITLKAGEQRQAALSLARPPPATSRRDSRLVRPSLRRSSRAPARRHAHGRRIPAIWQAMADKRAARGEIPWKSQDMPARPPMLPALWRRARLDDDAGRHRPRAARPAAVHLVGS